MKNTNHLFKTWDKQTLIDSQEKCFRMLEDYNSEPISLRTPELNQFYKRIANDLKFITEELKTR